MGHTKVRPAESKRFIKADLNYRKHDLPHAHNPETDFYVPSFTGFPLPSRGPDSHDMSGKPTPNGAAACYPGGRVFQTRKAKDHRHGEYHSVDVKSPTPTGITRSKPPPSRSRSEMSGRGTFPPGPGGPPHGDVLAGGADEPYVPVMFPRTYEKKMATMQWRGYIKESGKRNINRNMLSAYGWEFKDPKGMSLRSSASLQRLDDRDREMGNALFRG